MSGKHRPRRQPVPPFFSHSCRFCHRVLLATAYTLHRCPQQDPKDLRFHHRLSRQDLLQNRTLEPLIDPRPYLVRLWITHPLYPVKRALYYDPRY